VTRLNTPSDTWHALESASGADPVIDYDCAPPNQPAVAHPDRFAALDELVRLRGQADEDTALAAQLDVHTAYLRALLGERASLDDYVQRTQRCSARGWSADYVDHRGALARSALGVLDAGWRADTWHRLRQLEGDRPVKDPSAAIREFADKFEPTVRKLTGANAEFTLSVESVEVDAYWSYWLDGAGRNARLRINLANASLTSLDAYRFALREVLGHALQYASLADYAESHEVDCRGCSAFTAPTRSSSKGWAKSSRSLPTLTTSWSALVFALTTISNWSGQSCTYSSTTVRLPLRVATMHSDGCRSGTAAPSLATCSTAASIRSSGHIYGHTPRA
jgi:hypothetical protein